MTVTTAPPGTAATVDAPSRSRALPVIHPAAYHGLVGDAVRAIAPTTEADPVNLLVTTLALIGALAGQGPHVRVGGVEHPARIWPLIVGKTGSGRKGTGWSEARKFVSSFSSYSEAYLRERVMSGLASGEGLISTLADDNDPDDPDAGTAKAPDGLLTVYEPEFARVLAAARRESSTLGPVLRSLWEDGQASVMTRANPLHCDNAHLIAVTHVTPRELRLKLGEADIAGGTLNRFLPLLVERPHLLAHEPERPSLASIAGQLGAAVDRAKLRGAMRRTIGANRLWTDAYAALCADEPDGILGSILARGPAYVMRLSLIYALADSADAVDSEHLVAALAVWKYATDSARLLFSDSSGSNDLDRLADFIARSPNGRTRTEITRELFRGNKSSADLDVLLEELGDDITSEEEKPARGRPTMRYRWCGRTADSLGALLKATKETNSRTNPDKFVSSSTSSVRTDPTDDDFWSTLPDEPPADDF